MNYEELLKRGPYELGAEEKKKIYADMLSELTDSHRNRCLIYDWCCSALGDVSGSQRREEEIPMVPVSMFKEMELRSVPTGAVFKTVTSSGTTGQKTSKIVLDERTAAWQQQTLQRIMADFIGEKRIPMLIIDAPNVLRDRALFSARGAGILGFSIFGSKRCYALKEDMSLDLETVEAFLEKAGDGPVLVFGFTYMVWKYFYEPLKRSGHRLHLEHGFLIHGGGWKKLTKEAVSAEKFRDGLREVCGILDVRNYYGMAEQTGCIYMECECGHLHVSSYSDVLIRNMEDFSCCKNGTEGVIQVLTPMRKGSLGVETLNEILQRYLNPADPSRKEHAAGDRIFREGDKVMQIKNNYQLEWEIVSQYGIRIDSGSGVFNGDIGTIRRIREESSTVQVEYDEHRLVEYTFSQLDEIELAYAITIHKSQGSEYPAVLLPLLSGPKMLMNRNLLYTAVTRARKCVTILGSQEVVDGMIENENQYHRYTGLGRRILELESEERVW